MAKNKKLIIVLSIILVLIILVGGFLLYKSFKYDKNVDPMSSEARLEELDKLQKDSKVPALTQEESKKIMEDLDKNNDSIKTLSEEEKLQKLKELTK